MLMLSGVPFDKQGLPDLHERSSASVSETIQHTLYSGLVAPAVILAGLVGVAHRNTKNHADELPEEDAHE